MVSNLLKSVLIRVIRGLLFFDCTWPDHELIKLKFFFGFFMILREATTRDLEIIMNWIKDEKSCRIWAGPGLRFPFVWDTFLTDLGFLIHDTFALTDKKNNPVGVGQIIQRDGRLHLARILIDPGSRGKGYGKELCQALMKEGRHRYANKSFSLNVYRFNNVALSLYGSLGFVIAPNQSTVPDPDSIFMIHSGQ